MCLKDGVPCPWRWVVCPISACLYSSPTPAMNLIVAIQSCHHSLKIGDPRVPRLFQRSNRWMVELIYTLCRTLKSSKIYSYGPRLSDFTNTFIHEGNARISACTKRIHMNVLAYFNYYSSWSAERTLMQGFKYHWSNSVRFSLRWMLFDRGIRVLQSFFRLKEFLVQINLFGECKHTNSLQYGLQFAFSSQRLDDSKQLMCLRLHGKTMWTFL